MSILLHNRCHTLFLVALSFLVACAQSPDLRDRIAGDELLIALGTRQQLMVKPVSDGQIEVVWKDGSIVCKRGETIERALVRLRSLVKVGAADRTPNLSLKPSRYRGGSTVVLAKGREAHGYEIWYARNADDVVEAAGLIQTVLRECGLGIEFDITPPHVPPAEED